MPRVLNTNVILLFLTKWSSQQFQRLVGYLLVTFGVFYRLDFSALFWEALTVWSQWDLFLLRFSKGMFSLFVKCFYAAHGYCTLCFLEKNALCFIAGFKRDNWGFILMDGVSTLLCFKFLFLYAWQMTQLHLFVHLIPTWLEISSRAALIALFLQNWALGSRWLWVILTFHQQELLGLQ